MQSILKKSFFIVAAAVLVISIYFIAGVLVFANNQYNAINIRNLEEAAWALKNFTPAEVFEDNQVAMDWISRFNDPLRGTTASYHRITLISRNGQVVFDTDTDSAVMENHLDRFEFQAAIRNGIGSVRRHSATMGHDQLYAAISINDSDGRLAGVLRLSRLAPGFFSHLLRSTFFFLIGGLLIILSACAGLYYFSRRLSISVELRLDAELKKKTAELKLKAEEAEAESRHREVILNSIFDGVITLDSNLNIIHANPKICSLFNINKEKYIQGMSLLEFTRSTELEEAAEIALNTGQSCELNLKRYVSGVEQNFHVFVSPLEAKSIVIALEDISRLVKLERVRKDFAANVSHELRTPIQIIQGFAENILDCDQDNKEQIRYFAEIIRKNALGMENLTNDLLSLVSLEDENSMRPPMEDSSVASLIGEAVDTVLVSAQKKNIAIDISCHKNLRFPLYKQLFVQALVNLLDNSIKYSNDGSTINIYAYGDEENFIVEVRDKGIGIPAEHIDRIFERFYRVDSSRSRKEGGTGLGLSIVRHIALLHKGTITAESHAGEGSVFRLKL